MMRRNTDSFFGVVGLVVIFLIIFGVVGWVKNIIKLTDCDFEAPYKAEVVYTVGLFPAIGAITGWIDVEDGVKVEDSQ